MWQITWLSKKGRVCSAFHVQDTAYIVREVWCSWPHHIHREEAERDECQCSSHFLPFIQSQMSVYGMVSPTFMARLLYSAKSLWRPSYTRVLPWWFWMQSGWNFTLGELLKEEEWSSVINLPTVNYTQCHLQLCFFWSVFLFLKQVGKK